LGTQVNTSSPTQRACGRNGLWTLGDRVSLETAVPPVFGKEMR
jgi:hypothetical protein